MNDEMLFKTLASIMVELELIKAQKEGRIICDRISSPMGTYVIQTGPHILDEKYITVVTVELREKNGEKNIVGPCGVQTYDTFNEAKEGHNYWRTLCVQAPPLFLRDVVTNDTYSVPINN